MGVGSKWFSKYFTGTFFFNLDIKYFIFIPNKKCNQHSLTFLAVMVSGGEIMLIISCCYNSLSTGVESV